MRASAQAPSQLAARSGSRLGARPTCRRAPVRCQAAPEEPSIADRVAVAFTAVSASWALSTGAPALAADAAAAAPPAPTRPAAELQAEVEKRNQEALSKLMGELEASKAAAVKSVGELQARLAAEHAQMLKLQGELKAAKTELVDAQKEVEKEKGLLVAAKKQAADAAEAARSAELALRGQAGLDSLKSPLGLAATSGWTLAAIIAVTKKGKEEESFDYDSPEGADKAAEMRASMEAVRAEADNLRRDLTQQTQRLSELTAQLEQERGQNATLRETVLIMEAEVTDLEARMTMAKTEAFELQRKLEAALKEQQKASNGNGAKPSLSLFNTSSSSKPAAASTPKPATPARPAGASSTAFDSSSANGRSSSLAGAGASLAGSGKAVRVTFALQQELPFGQSLKLVGSHPALGAWKEDMGLRMTWGDGHRWTTSVALPAGTALEFKAVKVIEGPEARSEWEEGANHVLLVPPSGYSDLNVKVEWGAGTSVMDHLPSASSASASSTSAAKKEESHSNKVLASTRSSKWGGLLG